MTIAAVSAAAVCFRSDRSQPRPSDTREEQPPFGGTANSRQSLHDVPDVRCCSTSSSAASTTATHTACDHHCCGSAPSPAAAAIRKFRPGTTTRGHHSRAASISPLREENDLHGSICEKIGPRVVCDRTTLEPPLHIFVACCTRSSHNF